MLIKKIIIVTLGITLFGCEKEIMIPLPIVPIPIINNTFKSHSPKYTYPNNSVGQIKNGYYFPGFYINNDLLNIKYKLNDYFDVSKCYGDFDGDGLLDLFSFITVSKGNEYGKYALISNVLSNSYKIVYYNSTTNFLPIFEVNDYNGDGKLDIIQSNWNSHILFDGYTKKDKIASKLITFSNDNINVKDITYIVDVHDMATGDIDKDNDIDLLVWDIDSKNAKPILYKNNGIGEFTMVDSYDVFLSLKEILTNNNGFYVNSVELIDLNNDSYLDIIVGSTINREKIYSYGTYEIPTARIYWGNSKGTFDLLNNYSNLPNETILGKSIENPDSFLGFNFLDFDNDGDVDVIAVATPNFRGFHLLAYENLGNNQFKDITKSKIDQYTYTSKISSPRIYPNGFDGDFPNFFNIRFYDIDNDGDYDMVPDQIANWGGFKYTNNLYWENVNGYYIRRNM